MAISGAVDSLIGDTISGWVACDGHAGITVVISLDQDTVTVPVNVPRTDFAESSGRLGFKAKLPRVAMPSEFFNGRLAVHANHNGHLIPLTVWEPLRQAASLESTDFRGMAQAVRFLSPEKRLEFNKIFAEPKSWKQLGSKKPLCVISYAHDASAWFPYFYNYYTSVVEPNAIFIVTPNPQEFTKYALGGVISIDGFPYDNAARSQIMSRLCQGLQAYFEWTLLCDVDEIVVPHPASGKSFFETLAALNSDISTSRGFDIIQLDDELDFDFNQPVLQQRRFGLAASGLCKPHLARIPVRWSVGYHFTNYKPRFEPEGQGFVTLHLKWACDKIRLDVAKIVQKTKYAVSKTADYALESVVISKHPAMVSGAPPISLLSSDALKSFEKEFFSGLWYNSEEDLWAREHFVSSALFDFKK
ncbi:hypothetical protein [Microvirga flavescens]|uniref:hypothetical protein n=1 Tax=Microvirga flavescens TaxID=2249811 RepID=UPI001300BADE|nr:hypothetical protein [Microvirga flavescens]